jgi:hypothetical protein
VHEYLNDLQGAFDHPSFIDPIKLRRMFDGVDGKDLTALDAAFRWFRNGSRYVFLQDSDSLSLGASQLIDILRHLMQCFPWIERVTSYSRSSTIVHIHDDELKALRSAGLNRIHVGLESGSDIVLRMVRKGASKEIHVKAGLKVKRAGMELSEYVMPGLGGVELSTEHALETADALNQINPDFIRLRTLAVSDRAPLSVDCTSGRFHVCSDTMIADETRTLLENLRGITSVIRSDHILNLFEDLEGKLPEGRDHMLAILDEYRGMEPMRQNIYRIGRRLGVFSGLKDLLDSDRFSHVQQVCEANGITNENIDTVLDRLVQNFI